MILDVDEKTNVPLILGRPLLATSKALIDVKDDQMALRVVKEKVIFKLRDLMRHTKDFNDTCYYVDVVDEFISEYMKDAFIKDELSELLGDDPLRPMSQRSWWRNYVFKK